GGAQAREPAVLDRPPELHDVVVRPGAEPLSLVRRMRALACAGEARAPGVDADGAKVEPILIGDVLDGIAPRQRTRRRRRRLHEQEGVVGLDELGLLEDGVSIVLPGEHLENRHRTLLSRVPRSFADAPDSTRLEWRTT